MIHYTWMCVTMSVSVRKITKPIDNNIFKPTDNKLYKTGTGKNNAKLLQIQIKINLILLVPISKLKKAKIV